MDYTLVNWGIADMGNGDITPEIFREIVLYRLKHYGVCCHLMDTTMSSLSVFNVEDWINNNEEEYKSIKVNNDRIKVAEEEIKHCLAKDDYMQERYKDYKERGTKLSEEPYWIVAYSNNLKKEAEQFLGYLNEASFPEELTGFTKQLTDAANTALMESDKVKEMEKYKEDSETESEKIKNTSFNEFCEEELAGKERCIKAYKDCIKNAKNKIKITESSNDIIRRVFVELDKVAPKTADN